MADDGGERRGWEPIDGGSPPAPPHLPDPPSTPVPAGAPAPPSLPPGWQTPPEAWDRASLPKAGDARTGPLPLHPMTFTDILDGAFKLYRANALTVILITLAITAPIQLAAGFLTRGDLPDSGLWNLLTDPEAFEATAEAQSDAGGEQVAGQLLFAAVALLVTPFVAGAIARVVAESYTGGQPSAGPALRATLRRTHSLIGAWILVHLLEFSGVLAIGIGLIVTLPLFMALFVAVAPALVVEDLGAVAAMRRSWRLMRPRFWSVLATAVVAGVIATVVSGSVSTLPALLGVLVGRDYGWILVSLGGLLGQMIAQPVVAIVATLLYFDGRIRHEAYDLHLIARDLGTPSG